MDRENGMDTFKPHAAYPPQMKGNYYRVPSPDGKHVGLFEIRHWDVSPSQLQQLEKSDFREYNFRVRMLQALACWPNSNVLWVYQLEYRYVRADYSRYRRRISTYKINYRRNLFSNFDAMAQFLCIDYNIRIEEFETDREVGYPIY